MITSQCTGQVLEAKTSTFLNDKNEPTTYGKIQLLCTDMSGEFHSIQNIKVKTENFGWLPDIASYKGKSVTLSLQQNNYNGNISYYLSQPLNPKQ